MKHRQALALTLALSFFFATTNMPAQAQAIKPIKKDATAAKASHWVIGTTYQSDNVYLGRKDSLAVPYITPSIGYHDKSGFFITGSVSYQPGGGENRIDMGSIEGGYSYTSDKFNMECSAAKDFYSDQSFGVTSEVKGRLAASLSYDLGFIEPSLDLGAEFSGNADIGLGLGLGHSFTIVEDHLEIDPTFHVNGATQYYYANYYSKRRYSLKRKSGNPQNIKASLANPSKFQLLDYELEAPLEYTVNKKCKFSFSPTLAIPVNPATVSLTGKKSGNTTSTQTSTETLSNTFYFSVGVTYTW